MSEFKMVPVSFLAPEHLEMILDFFFSELSLLLLLSRGLGILKQFLLLLPSTSS